MVFSDFQKTLGDVLSVFDISLKHREQFGINCIVAIQSESSEFVECTVEPLLVDTSLIWTVQVVLKRPKFILTITAIIQAPQSVIWTLGSVPLVFIQRRIDCTRI